MSMLLISVTFSGVALADAIKVKDFWYNDVSVSGFKDGKVTYINASGTEVKKPLKDIKGFKIESLPQVESAEEAYEDRDYKRAYTAFKSMKGRARLKWQQQWVNFRIMRSADSVGLPNEAIEAYLMLMSLKADAYFLSNPPVNSIDRLSAAQKKLALQRLTSALRSAPKTGRGRKGLEQLKQDIDLVKVDAATTQNPPNGTTTVDPVNPIPGLPPRKKSVILVPREMDKADDDRVAALLRKGAFAEAKVEALKLLGKTDIDSSSKRLYQLGMADLHMAEKATGTDKEKLYKNAGLSFMRVVIYYPRSTSWVGPALIEAGYVHQKIGRKDLAKKLYNEADNFLDPDEEPELAERRTKLVTALQ